MTKGTSKEAERASSINHLGNPRFSHPWRTRSLGLCRPHSPAISIPAEYLMPDAQARQQVGGSQRSMHTLGTVSQPGIPHCRSRMECSGLPRGRRLAPKYYEQGHAHGENWCKGPQLTNSINWTLLMGHLKPRYGYGMRLPSRIT